MKRIVVLLLSGCLLGSASAAEPATESIAAIVSKVPAQRGEFETTAAFDARLEQALAPIHRIAVNCTPAYDADSQTFRVTLDQMVLVDSKVTGRAIGVTPMNIKFEYTKGYRNTYSINPSEPEMFWPLEAPVALADAKAWKNDLRCLIDFKVARRGMKYPGQDALKGITQDEPLEKSVHHHRPSLDSPFEGTTTEYSLNVNIKKVSLTRASNRKVVLERTSAQLEEKRAAEAREAEAERQRLEQARLEKESALEARRKVPARWKSLTSPIPKTVVWERDHWKMDWVLDPALAKAGMWVRALLREDGDRFVGTVKSHLGCVVEKPIRWVKFCDDEDFIEITVINDGKIEGTQKRYPETDKVDCMSCSHSTTKQSFPFVLVPEE